MLSLFVVLLLDGDEVFSIIALIVWICPFAFDVSNILNGLHFFGSGQPHDYEKTSRTDAMSYSFN